jgi:hypothetical protein
MPIVYRAVKGSRLTSAEGDENNRILLSGERLQVPKASGNGLRIGPDNDLTFGWHDLIGEMHVHHELPNAPESIIWSGGIRQYRYAVGDECCIQFHMPHDYVMGSDVYIHVHWSHDSTLVTGGNVTWAWELAYAKGHNQASFADSTITLAEVQAASTIRRQHMVCEAPLSITGGSANLFDSDDIEVDGLIIGRMYLAANNMTVSAGGAPEPFVHGIDVHYQSTGAPTKQRAPSFWA